MLRQQLGAQQIVAAYERAGDRAREHHLYADAAQWYEGALKLAVSKIAARVRITEKLVQVYFLGENPNAGTPLIDWLAKFYLVSPESSEKAISSLMTVAKQLWVDSKAEQALPVLVQAARLAEKSHLSHLHSIAILQRVRYLHLLERYDESRLLLATIEEPVECGDALLRTHYYGERGLVNVMLGKAKEAYQDLDKALAAANEYSDAYIVTSCWNDYAFAAWVLGDIKLAKNCYESALLVAREHQMLWRVADLYVSYADLLATMGRYTAARKCLAQALAYDAHAPVLDERIAEISILLAQQLEDTELVERCERSLSIAQVFQSGNSSRIASIAAAFARVYATRGEHRKARLLLHRALRYMRHMGRSWDLLLAVAGHGGRQDIEKSRQLLLRRVTSPRCEIAGACLSFFEAIVASRDERSEDARFHAEHAIRQFESLYWHGYTARVRALLPSGTQIQTNIAAVPRDSNNTKTRLTIREQEVVELVLRGLTNRAIADELSIREHTVESHMSAIMSRLGVRSRHQILDTLRDRQE